MSNYKTIYITVENTEIKLEINFDYTPGRAATRNDPPEPAEVVIKSIKHEDGGRAHQDICNAIEASDRIYELLCEEGELNCD